MIYDNKKVAESLQMSSATVGPTLKTPLDKAALYPNGYNYAPEFTSFISSLPIVDHSDPVTMRAGAKEFLKAMAAGVDVNALNVTDRTIPGPQGSPDVPVRIYTPKQLNGLVPSILYIHGGAFVSGDLNMEHAFAANYATQLGAVVVSVDYRLAPENPFPAGLEDCYATLLWMNDKASELNIDANHIAVVGTSAGGGLAAALALLAHDRGGPKICFQYLGMAELDDRMQTVSMNLFVDTPMWNRPAAEISWKFYLGNVKPGSAEVTQYAAPARATNLSGLPPAFVLVNEFDPFRDEDIIYAQRLLVAGVPVELHVYPGTFHGSQMFSTAAITKRQMADSLDALRRGLG